MQLIRGLHNLRDERLAEQVAEILGRHDLEASLLGLELTESAIMNDPEQSLGILTELQAMGVQLSIDDFGTGYSSLSYLKRLPVARAGQPEDMVAGVLYLVSDEAAYTTGTTLVMDGGATLC